jgi:radical SAM superfamily enzyme YgiQ (UPF0313 family)
MNLTLVAMHLEPSPRAVPLGPAMLASALRRAFGATLTTQVLDCFLQETPETCADRILATEPAWVGFSMYLWNRDLVLQTARLLKARRPELILFAGGSEATADGPGILAEPAMAFVVPGEGEELIVEAVTRLLRGETPETFQEALRPAPVADLATLSSPFLDGTLDPTRYPGQLWELSRGCPFTCAFCFEARGEDGIRRVPMARVEAELRLFEACGVAQVFVLDPTFNYDRKRAKEVLRLIATAAPGIHFFFEIRSEFVDRELARLFASIACTLQIGLQSAHDAVLRNINRTFDRASFESRILLLHQAGATYGFDLIYGLPGDNLEGFKASLDFALSLMPNHLDLFPLAVLPGTKLFETAASFGLEHQAANPYLVTSSPTFGPEAMAEATRLARGCEVFYNEGKAVPWFALVQGALETEPSTLFTRFATFLETHGGLEVIQAQRDFILALFEERGCPGQGAVAADLITYFGLSARLAERASQSHLNPDACPVTFAHDPCQLLEQLAAGITELEDLSYVLPETTWEGLLHLEEGEPILVPYAEPA